MSRLLAELEIDCACDEFLRARGYDVPQPIVRVLDAAESTFDGERWNAAMRQVVHACGEVQTETAIETVERVMRGN